MLTGPGRRDGTRPCETPAVTARVAAVVEQSWHRVPGGTATSTIRSLDAVAARGKWSVTGVAARHRDEPPAFVRPGIDVVHLAYGRRVLYEGWHRLRWPRLQHRVGPVDIVHATGGVVPPAGDAALVVTIHDLAFVHRPEHFTRRGVRFMQRGFDLAVAEAQRVIVPSHATAEDCVAHGLAAERIDVVGWGVEPVSVDDDDRRRVRTRHALPSEFVLWVGTAEPRKNLDGLIAAAERATALPLILAGSGGWGVDLSAAIAASPHDVRHIGPVTPEDLAVLYDLATIFAYPSLLEGFGMPVLEAMAQGTAVVTSAGTSTEEVVGEGGRVVDPRDIDALAAALGDLARDPVERARLAESGRSRAATMTWDATAVGIESAYASALR